MEEKKEKGNFWLTVATFIVNKRKAFLVLFAIACIYCACLLYTSTHHNDLFETRAIKRAFGEAAKQVAVNSTKSMIGHLLGAAGAVEAIVCVKTLQEGFIHQTVGTKETDAECDLDYTIGAPKQKKLDYAMSNSLGFGGHNVSILMKRYEEGNRE